MIRVRSPFSGSKLVFQAPFRGRAESRPEMVLLNIVSRELRQALNLVTTGLCYAVNLLIAFRNLVTM